MSFAIFLVFLPCIVISVQAGREMRPPEDPDWLNHCDRKEIFEDTRSDCGFYAKSPDYFLNKFCTAPPVKGGCCKSCRKALDEKNPLWKPMCYDKGIEEDVWKGCDDMYTSPCISVYFIKNCCGYCQRGQEFPIQPEQRP